MPGDLLDLGTVNDHLVLRDPHWEHGPNVPPGHGVAVLTVGDQTLDVDRAVDHRPDVIGLYRQRDQVRQFLLMQLQGCLARVPQFTDVGDVGQPPGSGLIELVETLEAATIKQTCFYICKWSLDFPLGLGPSGPTSDRSEAVMSGKGQKLCGLLPQNWSSRNGSLWVG